MKKNTDTPIIAADRKSKGKLRDIWDDFVAGINKNNIEGSECDSHQFLFAQAQKNGVPTGINPGTPF